MLTVYLTSASLRSIIDEGAGVVGEYDVREEYTRVYYQPRVPAVNLITYADRIFHAAHRLRQQIATSKLCVAPNSELIAIGHFDESAGVVVLNGPEAQAQLARWLDQDELNVSELSCQGTDPRAHQRASSRAQTRTRAANASSPETNPLASR